ncbi:D-2-hydroxyacid dehydrogenase [Anaeromicrobium sediminis]|uniref:Hydroxyacid dehydrogenase n=1 Tax=Anaeromicrobium sediminis TaxID=1478221 RepID=A0A267MC22_9FIRM|nr:D-2-hydroxyacid dehydrogenase [Anaeromicrobium sediminis]PAB56922.1 hydroxyacid dehydrogenase [Anaeromicrobium sediminis]
MKIVILDRKTLGEDIGLEGLNEYGEVITYETTKENEVEERIKNAHIVITNKVLLNEENMNRADNLKLICVAATGTNNIDLSYCLKAGIRVCNVAGYSTNSVTQHTFAMLFYILENMAYYDEYVKSKEYVKSNIFTNLQKPYYEIKGKIWGIIGLGNIGKNVAEIAKAFGATIVYYSTSGQNINDKYVKLDLEELLKVSDIVSIHAPLNDKTKNLLNYENLKCMKESSILINVGRGGIVNEEDLIKILNENKIRGAALDVLEKEPMRENSPLFKLEDKNKILITPHIGWASKEARHTLMEEIALNIDSFLKGEDRNKVV